MKKTLIIVGVVIAVLVVALLGAGMYLRSQTKKHSPADVASFNEGDAKVEVNYCRPYKKDRVIFGDLVPFGAVWRTGANEPTTFKTSVDLKIKGESLPAGRYSLWTIPGESEWQIIFNSEIPGWGVSLSGEAQRNPETDVLVVSVPAWEGKKTVEQFTITFDKMDDKREMILMWDRTTVVVPVQL